MLANPNLAKLAAVHSQELNTQNANGSMPCMILIAHLTEKFTNCNEDYGWGKQESLIYFYMFWYSIENEKLVKTSFYVHFM